MPDTSPTLLSVQGVSKRFGITQALDNVSVTFLAGEVHALMGENGAGKSTLGKVIAGLHRQDAGTVTIDNRTLAPGFIDEAFAAGVRIVHQELAQCPNLTVAENLCLHDLPRRAGFIIDRAEMNRRAAKLLERIEPGIQPTALLGSLSPGHRQIVQIAAALDEGRSDRPTHRATDSRAADGDPTKSTIGGSLVSAPGGAHSARVIVFDEPTSSLSIAETERLLKIIRQLASQGLTIIYVSHRMGEIFACCDRVTVLRDGKYIGTSRVADITEPALVEQMIGRKLDAPARRTKTSGASEAAALRSLADGGGNKPHHTPSDRIALEVSSISSPGKLQSISLNVRAGEIVGIGGLVGSGRSELLDAIFGLDPHATGSVKVSGQPVNATNPRNLIRAGVGYVPEDRRLQGLFFQLGCDENIVVPVMPRLASAGIRSLRAEKLLTTSRIKEFQVKAAHPSIAPSALSGGNQQKLLIARWMSPDVKVLLMDEPTRGIDVGTKAEVYRLVREAADRGAAVLLVSSEMPELLALSDRILVLCQGRLTGELKDADMTQANILRLATMDSAA